MQNIELNSAGHFFPFERDNSALSLIVWKLNRIFSNKSKGEEVKQEFAAFTLRFKLNRILQDDCFLLNI